MNRSSSTRSAADRPWRPLIVVVVGAIAISLAGILVRLSEVGPAATGFYRFLFALPLLWLWMAAANRRQDRERDGTPDGRAFRLIALGGLFLGLDLVVWNWAIHLSSVSNATLLGNAAPIWVADPARPDARPALFPGIAEAMTMVVGMKLRATPTATNSSPGRTATA